MYNSVKNFYTILLVLIYAITANGQSKINLTKDPERIWLDSPIMHGGNYQWNMVRSSDVSEPGEKI